MCPEAFEQVFKHINKSLNSFQMGTLCTSPCKSNCRYL